jgi:hypothetical protein
MYTKADLKDYMDEIRARVCTHCLERPPGGPPCLPLGKRCGLELHLKKYLDAVHDVHSPLIQPYLEKMHEKVCAFCDNLGCEGCPCPMEYLLVLVVQAIEAVDERHAATSG